MYRNAQRHPRDFKTKSGQRLQYYCPVFYASLVFSSLAEISLASWLLLEYRYNSNSPNSTTESGIQVILFSACWTAVTAGLYTCLFLHPNWYRHPVASIGAQAIWLLGTWTPWVSGTSVLNTAIPSLFVGGTCVTVIYCRQLQTLFAFSVLEILALTIGMLTMILLAWQSTRDILRPSRL